MTNGVKCPRCGKMFEPMSFLNRQGKQGHFCRECTNLILRVNRLEAQLNTAEFSFDRDDEEVARELHSLLVAENSVVSLEDEDAINHLLERRVAEEQRRLRILQQLKQLQKRKARS